VTALQSTIDEMNRSFLTFNDKAVGSGALHSNPDLARELRNTTEHFINLAKANGHSSGSDNSDDELEIIHTEAALPGNTQQEAHQQQSVPPTSSGGEYIGMGYMLFDEASGEASATESPLVRSDGSYNQSMGMTNSMNSVLAADYQNTNADFVLLPYTSASDNSLVNATTSNYDLSLTTDPMLQFMQSPLKMTAVQAPYTFSLDEKTFARRLHRAALERAFHLLSTSSSRPTAVQRVFRLSLLYHSKDALMAKLKATLTKSTTDPLEFFHTPFIHLGGAGLHYAKGRVVNGYTIKSGPLPARARLEHVETGIDPGFDIEIDLNDYTGDWFDANDVEGYLEEQGILINPQSSFAEAEINANSTLARVLDGGGTITPYQDDSESTKSSATSTASPMTPPPMMTNDMLELGAQRLFPELGGPDELNWSNADASAATGWLMGSGDKTPDFLASGWNDVQWTAADQIVMESVSPQQLQPQAVVAVEPQAQAPQLLPKTKRITLDVGKLIDEVIRRAVCLGRAPGFRKEDVIHSVTASVIQVI
jgi:hypothetical protein